MTDALTLWVNLSTLSSWILLAEVAWLIPTRTRPDLYFAVTVPPEHRRTPEGEETLARYRRAVALWGAASLALLVGGMAMGSVVPGYLATPLLLAGQLTAYFAARRRTRPFAVAPSTVREAVLVPRSLHLAGGFWGQAGPFLLLGGVALLLALAWSSIPERFPIHWGADGRPDGWSNRRPAEVFLPLYLGGTLCALLLALSVTLTRVSRRTAATGPVAERERAFVRFLQRVFLGGSWQLAAIFALIGVSPLLLNSLKPSAVLALTLGITLAGSMVLVIVILLGLQKLPSRASAGPAVGDRTPDACWKLGMIYINPDDPTIWVEQRFGVGYTVNLGQPAGRVILGLTLALPLAILGLVFLILP